MLVNKPYEVNDIVALKLNTGEELVAKLVEENQDSYILNKPLTLMPTPQGLAMSQSLFSVDVKNVNITVNKHSVVMHAKARNEVVQDYIKGTTGIVPASQFEGIS